MSGILDSVDLGCPLADVIPGARGQVLAALARLGEPVTVRELARQAGVAPQTALTIVNELTGTGLAVAQRAGQAHLVRLNRGHVLAPPLLALAGTGARLAELLRGELSSWPGLAGAWLYGAAARGDGDRGSVIDLLLVASSTCQNPAWAGAAGRLVTRLEGCTGNRVHLVQHSRGSFALAIRAGSRLIDQIRADGVPLTRASPSLLAPAGPPPAAAATPA